MKFREKNDDSFELYIDSSERKLLYAALRFYSNSLCYIWARYETEKDVNEDRRKLCEFLNLLDSKDFPF